MSGRTGKLTADAIARRGPRLVLVRIMARNPSDHSMLVIWREDRRATRAGSCHVQFLAKSYTLAYLLRIARAN